MADWQGWLGRMVTYLEEGVIALLLALMVAITFAQVIARHLFATDADWALELTTTLFAWLVLFGMSYGVKIHGHLGIDAFVKLFGTRTRRILGLIAVAAGLTYAAILFIGAWIEVARLYDLGIAGVELPLPRWFLMVILPIGLALLLVRLVQVGWSVWAGRQEGLLLGDEAADAMRQHLDSLARPPAHGGPAPPKPTGK